MNALYIVRHIGICSQALRAELESLLHEALVPVEEYLELYKKYVFIPVFAVQLTKK